MLRTGTGSLCKGGQELFQYFIKAHPDQLYFVNIGGSEDEISSLDASLKNLRMANYALLPYQEHSLIMSYQSQADLLCYITTCNNPMFWCTSPLKIFEYMSTGKPMIVSMIGSITEAIDDSNCYMFDPINPLSIENHWKIS